ncbi:MAG: DUF1156 domain-containing protein [Desulfobacterales bacterium]|nr:DUF1156 domain-containing protein [Desulfobacterales bacterium]
MARMAMSEKQIQQNYRPLIAIHKWFARRPGSLFRALLLSELEDVPIEQNYFKTHNFSEKHIFDPFMGGGTTVMEANRLGCMVTAADINPMAWWIVRQEILDLDLPAYAKAAAELRQYLSEEIGQLFETRCPKTGKAASAKYFLWVKTIKCGACGKNHDLFPNYLIAQDVRHTSNVFVCGSCGNLFESVDRKNSGACPKCRKSALIKHAARRNSSRCLHCDNEIRYPNGCVPDHRLFAIEYYLPEAHADKGRKGRLFKAPDAEDLLNVEEAIKRLRTMRSQFIPDDVIPKGDETERLHRWGYQRYRELFNARQLLGLELSCRWISKYPDEKIREALSTNLSDLLRYQNMLCRYDVMALKSLDIFSVHGFPVGLIQCESNILGIKGTKCLPVGSGGWLNITEKFAKAKSYCSRPFEIRHEGKRKVEVPIAGEWIGTHRNGSHPPEHREVNLICGDSSVIKELSKFDAVFTDPPYFGNVQYAELMDFCYIWLRKLVGAAHPAFASPSTRNSGELTGNINMGRDLTHFTDGISETFRRAAARLKPGSPLSFTYHHNKIDAYVPMAVAILDAGLVCSASLPCPAEMGASIHINGTRSSVIDTVFVCRNTGHVPRKWIVDTPEGVADIIREEIEALAVAGLKATQGDIRCIAHGHLTRLSIWNLRSIWKRSISTTERMGVIREWFISFGGLESILNALETDFSGATWKQDWMTTGMVCETPEMPDEISF